MRAACEAQLSEALRDALGTVRARVLVDELPLLSLLQAEPLQLQSSHLSFQEYFAARALCEEGTVLSGAPPWEWPAWWANAVSLGAEMGEPFGRGLLRAAGVQGDVLDLSKKLGGHRPTVLRVVGIFMHSLASVRWPSADLPMPCLRSALACGMRRALADCPLHVCSPFAARFEQESARSRGRKGAG